MTPLDRRQFLGLLAAAPLSGRRMVIPTRWRPRRKDFGSASGAVIKKVLTESSNTSGIAYGGGYLWMAANGAAIGRLLHLHELKNGRTVKEAGVTGWSLQNGM
jgi:hypothetical protein